MYKILVNDGMHETGRIALENAGFEVDTQTVEQADLPNRIGEYDVILVRSATKVTSEVIDAGSKLKLIGRGGVGLDNIDLNYAASKKVKVINTPAASSTSVAELVMGHLFAMCRFLPLTFKHMPEEGKERFKELKKKASKGRELTGKTLGIIGIGRIGQELARMAMGLGMHVVTHDRFIERVRINLNLHPNLTDQKVSVNLDTIPMDQLLTQSDFISLHIPGGQDAVIGAAEIAMMKDGAGIVNCARGGVVDEEALASAVNSGKLAFAGVDVFKNEPPVDDTVLKLDGVSLTPHIGAATVEAQERIGTELADQIIQFFSQMEANG